MTFNLVQAPAPLAISVTGGTELENTAGSSETKTYAIKDGAGNDVTGHTFTKTYGDWMTAVESSDGKLTYEANTTTKIRTAVVTVTKDQATGLVVFTQKPATITLTTSSSGADVTLEVSGAAIDWDKDNIVLTVYDNSDAVVSTGYPFDKANKKVTFTASETYKFVIKVNDAVSAKTSGVTVTVTP